MQKTYEDANDQHIRKVIAFGKAADSKLYANSDYDAYLDADEVVDAFSKGMLLIKVGSDLFAPVAYASSKYVTVSVSSNAAAVTEWTVATES